MSRKSSSAAAESPDDPGPIPKILDQVAPVQTSAKPGKPMRGTCRKCGCTEDKACASGCGWADATETRCTACFPPTLKSRAKSKPKARRRG